MDKAIRFLILGAVIGVCLTWLTGDLAVRAESSAGDISQSRGTYLQTVEREIMCGAAPTVILHNQNGGVTVTAWDKDAVSVIARKHVRESKGFWAFVGFRAQSASDASIQAALDEIEVDIASTPEKVSIDTVLPRHVGGGRWVEYELRVPLHSMLELHTSNGRIDVTEVAGDLVLESSNGQIVTNKTFGNVRADTSNGAVTCRDAGGPLDLESSNGAITVQYSGELAADAEITCTTSNGSIDLTLPQRATFALEARTSNGRIRSDFPLTLPAEDNPKHIAGTVGAGGPTVRLRTSNGSIRIGRS